MFILIIASLIIVYPFIYHERTYKYEIFEAYCYYPPINNSLEEIIGIFENEENITIFRVDKDNDGVNEVNGIDFLYNTQNLNANELSRFTSYLTFGNDGTITIGVIYKTPNSMRGSFSNDEEKEDAEEKIENQFYKDKEIVDIYFNVINNYFNHTLNILHLDIEYKGIDYGEKYQWEE